jgi:molybdate transport system ATP-binding protein
MKALAESAGEMTVGANVLEVRVRKALGTRFELDVNFALQPGINILFGPSGAGKTTLLDCIAGLTRPDSGRICVGGKVLFDFDHNVDVPTTRRNTGYVFQDLALFPHLSVESNIVYGLSQLGASARAERVIEVLEAMEISGLRTRKPAQLSGGERQRVALARAMVTNPSVLLLDEPLAALDLPVRMRIAEDLRRSIQSMPVPVLYVTHSRDEVFMLGDKLLVLERGKIIAQGRPHEVLSAPRTETVAQLAGFENIFDAVVGSVHEDRGTMTCRLVHPGAKRLLDGRSDVEPAQVEIETPLVQASAGDRLRVGISAGDILLATSAPVGLSARNILSGTLLSISQRDAIIVARVNCGVELAVHLTLSARDSLGLVPGHQVWVVVKTHSCHLLAQ